MYTEYELHSKGLSTKSIQEEQKFEESWSTLMQRLS